MREDTYVDDWLSRYPGWNGPYGAEPPSIQGISRLSRKGEGSQQFVDDVAMDFAFEFEFNARRALAGGQFQGIQRGRWTLVWQRSAAQDLRTLLRDYEVGEEARTRIDEALALMNEALRKGLHILEWDRPGYDDVTGHFRGVVKLARSLELPSGPIPGVQIIPATERADEDGGGPKRLGMYAWLVGALLGLLGLAVWFAPTPEAAPPIDCDSEEVVLFENLERLGIDEPTQAERAASLASMVSDGNIDEAVRAYEEVPSEEQDPRVKAQLTTVSVCRFLSPDRTARPQLSRPGSGPDAASL